MILNVAKIEPNVHVWSDLVIAVASLSKALQNICLPSQESHQSHDVLASHANPTKERMHIIASGNKDLVFDGVGSSLNLCYDWRKGIDNVINQGVTEPVAADVNVVSEFQNTLSNEGSMLVRSAMKSA